jgi:hypothetical protein
MQSKFRRPESGLSKALSDLGVRAALAKRVTGGLARAIRDPHRLQELWHRLQDYEEYDRLLSVMAAPRKTFAARVTEEVPFPLLVTSYTGLHVLGQDGWHCLLPIKCFGVARREDTLFISAVAGIYSLVLSAEIVGKETIHGLRNMKILARYESRYNTDRLHQIAYDPRRDLIQCTNSRRNSLMAVDPNGRGVVEEKFLFFDSTTGSPIFSNQNNVNGVMVNGDALLFTCLHAGAGSALGFVADDTVRIYRYPANGLHDIVIHDGGIMFTESFREDGSAANDPKIVGAIRFRGEEYLTRSLVSGTRKFVIRGLTMRGNILIVGVSTYSPTRAGRMAMEGGGVIVFRDEKLAAIIDGPLSQTFDLLPIDCVRTDAAGPERSVAELDAMFRRDVGPLIFEGPLIRNAKIIPPLR